MIDAAVIGAGHNGLVAAAYLARAGLQVTVCERRDLPGGACVTEELWPGVRASPGAYTLSLLRREIISDLDLRAHGLDVAVHEPYLFAPLPDGRRVVTWSSRERTARQLEAEWSAADAAAYTAWSERWEAAAARARPLMLEPPDRERWLDAVGPEILEGPIADDLAGIPSEAVRVPFALQGLIGTLAAPEDPGTAFVGFYHDLGEAAGPAGAWGFARGGMGAVTGALRAAAEGAGAEIRLEAPVAEILVDGGRAVGAVIDGGDEVRAGAVLAGSDPLTTARLPGLPRPDGWRQDGPTVKVMVLLDSLPEFPAWPGPEPWGGTIDVGFTLDDLSAAAADARAAPPPRPPRAPPGDRARLPDRGRPDPGAGRPPRPVHVLPVLPARRRRRGRRRRRHRPVRRDLPGLPRSRRRPPGPWAARARGALRHRRRAHLPRGDASGPAARAPVRRPALRRRRGPVPGRLGRPSRRRGHRRARLPGRPRGARGPRGLTHGPGLARAGYGARRMSWRVVIAGGGFAGLYAARTLERVLPHHAAQITLVNDVNFMLYTPLLPGAAGGTLEPRHVVVPLREELHHTDLRLGTVTGAHPERNCLSLHTIEGHHEQFEYDQLVIALGSVSRTLPVPGLSEHGIGFKTLSEAIALRNRAVANLEMAETLDDPAARAALLTFVFVGAGYAGVEGMAELQDFMAGMIDLYPRSRTQGFRFMLVEARERIMYEISASLAAFAERELRGRGIEIRTGTTVEAVQADRVRLGTGEEIPCRTLVWTAGVRPHPAVAELGLPLDRTGRIVADKNMRVQDHPNVWAIGDAAAVPDPARPGDPSPPTAQHALRQGRRVARNVAAELGAAGRVKPFTYTSLGVFVDMGRYQAVAETLRIRWRGFPAWFLARSYHLLLMPGTKRKFRLVADWTVGLFFKRDTSELGQLGHPPRLEAQSLGGTTGEPEQPSGTAVAAAPPPR